MFCDRKVLTEMSLCRNVSDRNVKQAYSQRHQQYCNPCFSPEHCSNFLFFYFLSSFNWKHLKKRLQSLWFPRDHLGSLNMNSCHISLANVCQSCFTTEIELDPLIPLRNFVMFFDFGKKVQLEFFLEYPPSSFGLKKS